MTKPILWVGQSRTCEEVTRDFVKERFGIDSQFADNVRRAVGAIDSKKHRGVYIGDLMIPCGNYRLAERMLDSDYDGGLFVVKYASERGLPVLAHCVSCTSKDVREKASELGAKVLFGLEADAWLNEIKTFFRENDSRKTRIERKN